MPVHARERAPAQIIQLTCGDDLGWVGLILVALVAGPVATLAWASLMVLLRNDQPPWFPAVLSTAGVLGVLWAAATEDSTSAGWAVLLAALAALTVAAGACWSEVLSVRSRSAALGPAAP